MSLTAPPSENRTLATEMIRLTGQRARVAQRVVNHPVDLLASACDSTQPASEGAANPVRVGPFESIYDCVDDPSLPLSVVTNTNLHHYLASAMDTQPGFGSAPTERRRGWRARLRRLFIPTRQEDFNAAVLHVMHQLDHRSQVQEHRIAQLQARLAEARRLRSWEPDEVGFGA